MQSQEPKPLVAAQLNGSPPALADSSFVRSSFYVAGPTAPHEGGALAVAQAPSLAGMTRAFQRRWPLAIGAAVGGAVLIVAAIFIFMPLKYNTSVRFLLAKVDDTEFSILKSNQAALVKSPTVLRAAMERKLPNGKEIKNLTLVRAHADPIEWTENGLKVDFPSVEIMRVSLAGDRPDETAELLNAVAAAVIAENEHRDRTRRQDRIDQLKVSKRELDEEIRGKQAMLDSRFKTLDEKQRDESVRLAQEAVRDAQKSLRENDTKLEVNKSIQEGLKARVKNGHALPVPGDKLDEILKTDPRAAGFFALVQKAQEDIFEVKRVAPMDRWNTLVTPLEKERDRYLKEVARVRETLRPELEKRARDVEMAKTQTRIFELGEEIQVLERLSERFNEDLTKVKEHERKTSASAFQIPPELRNLRDSIENIKSSRNMIEKQIIELDKAYYQPRVSIQSPAPEPTGKDASRQIKMAGAGGFAFFFVILFGVTYLEFRSQKIGEAADLTGAGINLVGTIPNMPAKARQPISGKTSAQEAIWQNQLGESVDSIRTLLLHMSRTESLRVIMVTSAVGGEGKTSLASQLAASLSRAWRKTLLIDGDLRRPAGHALFDLSLEPGLSEVLRGEVKAADAVKPTAISRLWMMPAGHWDSHAVQALAQDSVRTLLDQLKQQYDFIIIDSCPVLPVADSLVLGQHVDGVLFSVLRDVSRLPALHAAHQKMTNLGIRTLGAVVLGTKSDLGASDYKYVAAAAAK